MESLFFNGMLSNFALTMLFIIASAIGSVFFIKWIESADNDQESKKAGSKATDHND